MTLDEFKVLRKEQRERLIFDNGTYLASRQEPEFIIDLYQIDSFYIEAYYHHSKNKLIYARAFSSLHELAPYLQKIDLAHLFNK